MRTYQIRDHTMVFLIPVWYFSISNWYAFISTC